MAPPAPPAQPDNSGLLRGAAFVGGLVLLVIVIGQCSSPGQDANRLVTDAMNETNMNMSNAIAEQEPPPPAPLDAASVARGISHVRIAVAAEGFPGAMIYSQNCYDALSRQFSWSKLDTCGAFDMLAVRSIDSADASPLSRELNYFESEAAARRYLAAATGAGQAAPEADLRLSDVQSRAAQARPVARRAPPPADKATETTSADTNTALFLNDLMEEMNELEFAE